MKDISTYGQIPEYQLGFHEEVSIDKFKSTKEFKDYLLSKHISIGPKNPLIDRQIKDFDKIIKQQKLKEILK